MVKQLKNLNKYSIMIELFLEQTLYFYLKILIQKS